jgi:hypothetical protein
MLHEKGERIMTAMIVFTVLIVANIAYSIYDSRRAAVYQMMDDYYRVEFKKTYNLTNEQNTVSMY